jgi:acetyltransferase/esterase
LAYEPPLVTLLPDGAQQLDMLDEVYEIYRRSGVDPAMEYFAAAVGLDDLPKPPPGTPLPPGLVELLTRIRGNQEFWLEHELRQYSRVVPDIAALKAVAAQIVLAGGEDSRQHLAYRPNTVIAEHLGRPVVDLPGGHVGYLTHPADFAARLADLLAAS